MFKFNNKSTRTTSSGVFIVNFRKNFTPFSGVSIVAFEQINVLLGNIREKGVWKF